MVSKSKVSVIKIPARYCGPPGSGNGGYTCGLVSFALGGPAEVTLRRPIPIERELQIHVFGNNGVGGHGDGSRGDGSRGDGIHLVRSRGKGNPGTGNHGGESRSAILKDADELIAEGVRFDDGSSWSSVQTPQVSFSDAERAAANSPAFRDHPFPGCFVCGPERAEGDGMRIFPGAVESNHSKEHAYLFAAPWVPDRTLADANGRVQDEFIWAALDCPTGFAGGFPYEGKLVTGRLGARLIAPVAAGERCVLVSWRLGVEGRKHHAAAALLGEDGTVRAEARATWIKL